MRGPQPPKALGSLWARGLGRRSRPPSPVLAPEAQPGTRSPTAACCPLGQVPRSRAGRRRRHRPQVKLPRTPGPDAACLVSGRRPSLRSGPRPSAPRPLRGLPQRRRQQQQQRRQQQRGGAWRRREQLVPARPRARNPRARRLRGPGRTPGGDAAPGRQVENQGTVSTLPPPPPAPRPGVGLREPAPLPAAPARALGHPCTRAPSAPSALLLHLPLGLGQGGSARPLVCWVASRPRR